MEKDGIHLVLWQIPVIKYAWKGANEQLASDEAYAIAQGYCVKSDDGTPYRITDNWFKGSLLMDFTNPKAVAWWFSRRAYLLDELHVKGFKTDGGEFLFDDSARLENGETGETAHNRYPGQYVGAYNDFLRAHHVSGVTFSRAGYIGAQSYPIHWAGDQLSEWAKFRAQLTAGLTAGLSGIPFWSFDIGGFAGDFPSRELYLRAVAMAAFCPVMQWHSEPRNGQFYETPCERWNNDRSPWNLSSLYHDQSILDLYRRFACLRMSLLPYLYQEARHAAATARPLMAHLLIDFFADPIAQRTHDEYMLGRDLLIAPITTQHALSRRVYLPRGTWHALFTGQSYAGNSYYDIPCGLDSLPVFIRNGAAIAVNLSRDRVLGAAEMGYGVGSTIDAYCQLGFLCYGNAACDFCDDLGNQLRVADGAVSGSVSKDMDVLLIDALTPVNDVTLFERKVKATLKKVNCLCRVKQ